MLPSLIAGEDNRECASVEVIVLLVMIPHTLDTMTIP
jgi:hypothetical protein